MGDREKEKVREWERGREGKREKVKEKVGETKNKSKKEKVRERGKVIEIVRERGVVK